MGEKIREYRSLEDSYAFQSATVDDEHSLAGDDIISSGQRRRPRTDNCRFQLGVLILVLSLALNVATYTQLRRQQGRTGDIKRSRFGKMSVTIVL